MTYENKDLSAYDGKPIELYKFKAENKLYYMTDHYEAVTFEGKLYAPKQIKRTDITYTMSIVDLMTLKVSYPVTESLAAVTATIITPTTFTVEIFQKHLSDPDNEAKRIFSGYALSISSDEPWINVSFGTALQAQMNGETGIILYSFTCNHEFGDAHCGVDRDDYKFETTAAAYSNGAVDLAADPTEPDFYAGGTLVNTRTGEQRPIIAIDSGIVYLLSGFVDFLVGDPVKLWPGCDHTHDGDAGCKTRYNNIINYGGFPLIPRKNPFVEGFGEVDYEELNGEGSEG